MVFIGVILVLVAVALLRCVIWVCWCDPAFNYTRVVGILLGLVLVLIISSHYCFNRNVDHQSDSTEEQVVELLQE